MAIGKRITERLDELQWTRNDLMERVDGLTPQALYNLIKRDSVRSEWDEKIADALGVSVLWLVYGRTVEYKSGKVTQLASREPDPLPHPLDKIVEAARQLSTDGQLVLLGRAQELAATFPKSKANHSS